MNRSVSGKAIMQLTSREEVTVEKIRGRIQIQLKNKKSSDIFLASKSYESSFTNFVRVKGDANDLLDYLLSIKDNDIFLKEIYKIVLDRSLEGPDYTHYMRELNIKIPKILIIYQIANSKEAISKRTNINISLGIILKLLIALIEDRIIRWGLKNKQWIKKFPLMENKAQFIYRTILAHRISTKKR